MYTSKTTHNIYIYIYIYIYSIHVFKNVAFHDRRSSHTSFGPPLPCQLISRKSAMPPWTPQNQNPHEPKRTPQNLRCVLAMRTWRPSWPWKAKRFASRWCPNPGSRDQQLRFSWDVALFDISSQDAACVCSQYVHIKHEARPSLEVHGCYVGVPCAMLSSSMEVLTAAGLSITKEGRRPGMGPAGEDRAATRSDPQSSMRWCLGSCGMTHFWRKKVRSPTCLFKSWDVFKVCDFPLVPPVSWAPSSNNPTLVKL